MDTFRLTLIFLGLAILFFIYILEMQRRRKLKQRRHADDDAHEQGDGSMEGFDDEPFDDPLDGDPTADLRATREPLDDIPPTPPTPRAAPIGAGILGNQASPPAAAVSAAAVPGAVPSEPGPSATRPVPQAPAPKVAVAEMAETDTIPEPPEGIADLIIALQVAAPAGQEFSGRALQDAFRHCDLEHGDMYIYHRYTPRRRTLFYVANSQEPGSFDLTRMTALTTPSVVFFLRLPTVLPGRDAFDRMHAAAIELAGVLGGEVQDQQRQPLTRHQLTLIRERIAAYEHKIKARRRELDAG